MNKYRFVLNQIIIFSSAYLCNLMVYMFDILNFDHLIQQNSKPENQKFSTSEVSLFRYPAQHWIVMAVEGRLDLFHIHGPSIQP